MMSDQQVGAGAEEGVVGDFEEESMAILQEELVSILRDTRSQLVAKDLLELNSPWQRIATQPSVQPLVSSRRSPAARSLTSLPTLRLDAASTFSRWAWRRQLGPSSIAPSSRSRMDEMNSFFRIVVKKDQKKDQVWYSVMVKRHSTGVMEAMDMDMEAIIMDMDINTDMDMDAGVDADFLLVVHCALFR